MVRRLTGLVAAILLCSLPASAATITFGGTAVNDQGQFSNVPGATLIDFNGRPLGTQDFTAGIAAYDNVNVFQCVGCSGNGDVKDDTTNAARAFGGPGGLYVLDFSQPISYFGLYWGSPDQGNEMQLYNGATLVRTVTGLEVGNAVGFGLPGGGYVNVFAGVGEQFTRVVFVGGQFPFESDNHAFAVPEPGALLLLAAAGGGWFARRRKQRRQ